ncbi:type II toxin-antitoxin system RelE/ParE family toxin [Metapseudomonas otitidis]|uniref:type II toxin-antitoxin system RelE/ParE family toxin n=1 Tax=Metapseudomonas otitidis TaxID=319939 RepID=UPI00209B4060|nr:type II toxin-antitoxin system RelE/ParE family toxin [Pseudomonas otitidis]MCO7557794.1 type II toxin-antitoxin system RelE/ParE family toxin [Pseudomonas otitidis]
MKKIEVVFTSTGELSAKKLRHNLVQRRGKPVANQLVNKLIQSIMDRLSEHPLSCPVSPQASQLGVLHYREYNTDGYRVLYEYFPEEHLVTVALVLSQQQSVEQMLTDYCLLWMPDQLSF